MRWLFQIWILCFRSADMSLQSLPSRNLSDSDPITPWKQKKCGRRKAYVFLCILLSMFPKFHIFVSMGTFLPKNINILPHWLINLPIFLLHAQHFWDCHRHVRCASCQLFFSCFIADVLVNHPENGLFFIMHKNKTPYSPNLVLDVCSRVGGCRVCLVPTWHKVMLYCCCLGSLHLEFLQKKWSLFEIFLIFMQYQRESDCD